MPDLLQGPSRFVDELTDLEEGDSIIINDRKEPMEVTAITTPEFEPIKLRIIILEGSRGGRYAIRIQQQDDRPDDVGLMRYHTTKGRWVNASEGLVSFDEV